MSAYAATILLFSGSTNPVISVIDSYPSLSLDGTTLLFQSNRTGRNALYLADADGSNLRMLYERNDPESGALVKLTDDEWSNVQPSVAPTADAILTYRNIETADYEFGHIARTPVSMP